MPASPFHLNGYDIWARKDRNKHEGEVIKFVKEFDLLNLAKSLHPAAYSCFKSLQYVFNDCIKDHKCIYNPVEDLRLGFFAKIINGF